VLLIDAIDLGLHLRMPTLDEDGEISSAGDFAKASASAAIASVSGLATPQRSTSAEPPGLARLGLRKRVCLPARRPREGGGVSADPSEQTGKPNAPTRCGLFGFSVRNQPAHKKSPAR
jgi:hypothetical protein